MKILKRLTNIFKSNQPEKIINIEKISFVKLGDKLTSLESNTKSSFNYNFNMFSEEVISILNKLEESIVLLENFDIYSRKVDERIRNISNVGRKEYIEAIRVLIQELKGCNPEELNTMIRALERFSKKEFKAELKASQIIGKEVENIKKNTNNLRKIFNNFFEQNDLLLKEKEIYNKVHIIIKDIKKQDEDIRKNMIDISSLNKEISNVLEDKKKLEKEILYIDKSQDYAVVQNLLNEIELCKRTIKELGFRLRQYLDEKVILKYLHLKKNVKLKILENYILDPLDSLEKDQSFEIVNYQKSILEEASSGNLNLKANEMEKIKESIDSIRNSYKDYKLKLKNLKELEKKLENGKILQTLEEKKKDIEVLGNSILEGKNKLKKLKESKEILEKGCEDSKKELKLIFLDNFNLEIEYS